MLAYGTKALVLAEGEVGVLVHVHLKHNHENKRLFRFLYNSYVSKYEFFLLFLRKQSSYLRLISSGTNPLFYEDGTFWGNVPRVFSENHMVLYGSYVRYQGKAILASKGTLLLKNITNLKVITLE
jgi:hypothetical protein